MAVARVLNLPVTEVFAVDRHWWEWALTFYEAESEAAELGPWKAEPI